MTHPPPPSSSPPPPPPDAAAPPRKSAWPLYLLAALAFVPIVGIVFGAIGLTWGLLSSRPRALRAGFIAAGGAALNFAGMGAGAYYMATRHGTLYDSVAVVQTRNDLAAVVRALEAHHEEHGAYPRALAELQRRPAALRTLNIYDQMGGILTPRVYGYVVARDGRTYDLFSVGPDREPGTPDDVRPVLPDSIASRAGFRPDTSAGR